ncbi:MULTISPECIES: CPBP family intramembrane glutamic endopeptidase [unclassified Corynebacterium]|uniref:CPBP family intramembrane glutamic endopeptidase n=1 Tax=unclassified Corynebacterium TaxID=2624378 RepID=UPI0029C9FF54|nr:MULTISPECIES: CPBP family intramembrane glutamic endopeptidase [unclassified Corynebacterium]WPF66056.1 CPBP family intramembrane metalloprotease [Corynebacterium sp. 22KM0430]WPF68548.1 CPBP family intramembrane metalloprotease [Corynebacterium sp. 21KM1197]
MTSRLRLEILLVLALTFGTAGVRATLRLIDALASEVPLSEQSVTLNATQSTHAWLNIGLQLCSAVTLFAWGGLALFLLSRDRIPLSLTPRRSDLPWGAGLAALIGIPGLLLYLGALHLGLSKEVVAAPSGGVVASVMLLVSAATNAFAEEIVVVLWLCTRLRQLGWSWWAVAAASSLLRGSYHLYQGISAGVGNIVMGLIFCWFFRRTGRVWPLVVAHFLIDAVAFLGYSALGGRLP